MARGNSRAQSDYRGTYGNPLERENRARLDLKYKGQKLERKLKAQREPTEYEKKVFDRLRAQAALRREALPAAAFAGSPVELKKGQLEIVDVEKFLAPWIEANVTDGSMTEEYGAILKLPIKDFGEKLINANSRTRDAFGIDPLKLNGDEIEIDTTEHSLGDIHSDIDKDEKPSDAWRGYHRDDFEKAVKTAVFKATGYTIKNIEVMGDYIEKALRDYADDAHEEYHQNKED